MRYAVSASSSLATNLNKLNKLHRSFGAENVSDTRISIAQFSQLAQDPAIGSLIKLRAPELGGLRKWRVRDFPNFLIFYLPRPDGVSIVRVLYASQDWWGLLCILSDDSIV